MSANINFNISGQEAQTPTHYLSTVTDGAYRIDKLPNRFSPDTINPEDHHPQSKTSNVHHSSSQPLHVAKHPVLNLDKLNKTIWNTLFCISRAYHDVDIQACEVRLTVFCLALLMSKLAEKQNNQKYAKRFTHTIYFFNQKNCKCTDDFKLTCKDKHTLFHFMCEYYNSCRVAEHEHAELYSNLEIAYTPEIMTKSWWGPQIWFLIHVFAHLYDGSEQYLKTFKCFNMCLTRVLPCNVCRTNFSNKIFENNMDDYIKQGQTLFYWTVIIHNLANVSLNKPEYSYERALKELHEKMI